MEDKTIIVGIDFKDNTLNLCRKAARYAQKLKASIRLVHAFDHNEAYSFLPNDGDVVDYLANSDIPAQLDQLEAVLKLYNIEVDASMILRGRPHEVLCKVANKFNTAAIVVGVGKHYMFEQLVGSTADQVSRMADQKVIVMNDSKFRPIDTVLCAFDFSVNSYYALASAARFARFFKAKLDVLHVHNSSLDDESIHWHVNDAVNKFLEDQTDDDNHLVRAEVTVKNGEVEDEILRFVKQDENILLSIGPSGHNDITRFFLGSTVSSIIRKAPCTIVVSPKSEAISIAEIEQQNIKVDQSKIS